MSILEKDQYLFDADRDVRVMIERGEWRVLYEWRAGVGAWNAMLSIVVHYHRRPDLTGKLWS